MVMELKFELPKKIQKAASRLYIGSIIIMIFSIIFAMVEEDLGLLLVALAVLGIGYLQKILLNGFAVLVDNSLIAEERAEKAEKKDE